MYKDIPGVEPLNGDITIWRYMDLASFMSLILEEQLVFRRASSFKDYYDTFVDLDDKSKKHLIKLLKKGEQQSGSFYKVQKISLTDNDKYPIQPMFQDNKIHIRFDESGQHFGLSDITYCSSWHENDHENYALWKIYLGNNPEGVAIKTSVKKIRSILNNQLDDFFIGRIDYDSSEINILKGGKSNHAIILRKREEYEYENEIRIYTIDEKRRISKPYLYLPITKVEDLIEELWISPFAGSWFFKIIQLFLKKNDLNIKVKHSSIKER